MTYVAADKLHAVASVGAEEAKAAVGLRRGAVDDGNIVACDDNAVLAFLYRTLGDNALFDDFHAAKVQISEQNAKLITDFLCSLRIYL
jgi:hypothetical protein